MILVLTVFGAVYGHQLIIKLEKGIAWVTGLMTLAYLFFFIPQINFSALNTVETGNWVPSSARSCSR